MAMSHYWIVIAGCCNPKQTYNVAVLSGLHTNDSYLLSYWIKKSPV